MRIGRVVGDIAMMITLFGLLAVPAFSKSDLFDKAFDSAFNRAFATAWERVFGGEPDGEKSNRFEQVFKEAFESSFSADESTVDDGLWNRRAVRDQNDEWVDEFVYEASADDLSEIALRTVNGNVVVTGSDENRVRIVVTRRVRATDPVRGRAYKERIRPELKRERSSLTVEWRSPEDQWPRILKDVTMVYDAVVPSRVEVEATSVNGNVLATNAGKRVVLTTVNGNATLDSNVDSVDGVTAKTVNGNIGVDVRNLSPRARFETVNGNVELAMTDGFDADLAANTVNGNIDVLVPTDSRFELTANVGMHGTIRTDWGSPQSEKRFGTSYNVAVNGGGQTLKLNTLNGIIRVRKVGHI
jgi:hypothetical protein